MRWPKNSEHMDGHISVSDTRAPSAVLMPHHLAPSLELRLAGSIATHVPSRPLLLFRARALAWRFGMLVVFPLLVRTLLGCFVCSSVRLSVVVWFVLFCRAGAVEVASLPFPRSPSFGAGPTLCYLINDSK